MQTVSSHYLSTIIECIAVLGINTSDMLSRVPDLADRAKDPISRVDGQILLDILDDAAEAASDPCIGLKIGAQFNVSVLNQTGKLLPMSRTYGQALQLFQRYHKLTQSVTSSYLEIKGDIAQIKWNRGGLEYYKIRRLTEAFLTGITAGSKWLMWNEAHSIHAVHFRHPYPGDPQICSDIVGCEVKFDQPEDALIFDRSMLDAKIPASNPEGVAELTRYLDRLMIKLDDGEGLFDRVAASIREQLHNGPPTLEQTAKDVGLGVSNLRYRLKTQNRTFRGIVETVRKEICGLELANGRKFYQIAQKLGFHDQAAFNRAFQKWYGMTPGKYIR